MASYFNLEKKISIDFQLFEFNYTKLGSFFNSNLANNLSYNCTIIKELIYCKLNSIIMFILKSANYLFLNPIIFIESKSCIQINHLSIQKGHL